MGEWFDSETFWEETYPFMFVPERIEGAQEEVEKLLKLVSMERGSVLDLCCGPGRHAVELARRGLEVTGVDLSRFLLQKAGEMADASNVEVEWVEDDMRRFIRPQAFDLVLSLFTSFGYFENQEEDLGVLRNIHASLKPGGIFLIDLMGKECLARRYQPVFCERLDQGGLLVQINEVCDDWTRVRNEWVVVKDGRSRSFVFLLNIYSGRELRQRLKQAGFSHVRLYGDLDGNEYGSEAMRLVAVARKA